MPQVEKILIFLASPSDVKKERQNVEIIVNELNSTLAKDKGVTLEVICWEKNTFPGYGQDAQALINAQIAAMANYSLFVGIIWNRLGTPTPRSSSGTVEEFERAVESNKQNGIPRIWFYFRQSASKLDTDDQLEQRKKVLAFKKQVQANGMPWDYKNPIDFKNKFRNHITQWLITEYFETKGHQNITYNITKKKDVLEEKHIRILYVEDSDEFVKMYQPIMGKHFGDDNITRVITAVKALSILRSSNQPDVLVADLYIPPGPDYQIPEAANGLPRIGGRFAYGMDICAVALQLNIPIVALSTAPVEHQVRKPIEKARRMYGGTIYHLHKKNVTDPMQLVSAIQQVYARPPEDETLNLHLKHLIEDHWPDSADITARLAVLNEVQMEIENASQPTITTIKNSPVGKSLLTLLEKHTAESSEERMMLHQIKEILNMA